MSDEWVEAHSRLVNALEHAQDVGMTEDEVLGAVDDVFHEPREAYHPGPPKPEKPNG